MQKKFTVLFRLLVLPMLVCPFGDFFVFLLLIHMLDLSFVYLRPLDFFSTPLLHRSPVRAFVRPSVCFFVRLFSHLVIDYIILSFDGLSVCVRCSLFVLSVVR